MLGSPSSAKAGALICILSGPASAINVVQPFIKGVVGRATIECVEQAAEQSSLLKIIANIFILNVVEILAEGLTMAEKTSVAPEKLRFDFSHKSGVSDADLEKIEKVCTDYIRQNLEVFAKEVPLATAQQINGVRAGASR